MSKNKPALKRKVAPAIKITKRARATIATSLTQIRKAAERAAAKAVAPAGVIVTVGHAPTREELLKLHPLSRVFQDALAQATSGKGDARHGQGRDSAEASNFMAQDWRAIGLRHGPAFLSGQAEKKLRESLDLPFPDRRRELLGVLVYVGMLVIHHDKAGS